MLLHTTTWACHVGRCDQCLEDAQIDIQDAARAKALRLMGIEHPEGVAIDDCLAGETEERVKHFTMLVVAILEGALANAKLVESSCRKE